MLQLSSSDEEVFKNLTFIYLAFQYQTTVGWEKSPWNAASSLCLKQPNKTAAYWKDKGWESISTVPSCCYYSFSPQRLCRHLLVWHQEPHNWRWFQLLDWTSLPQDLSCFQPTLMHRVFWCAEISFLCLLRDLGWAGQPATMLVWRMQPLPTHSSAPSWMDHTAPKTIRTWFPACTSFWATRSSQNKHHRLQNKWKGISMVVLSTLI